MFYFMLPEQAEVWMVIRTYTQDKARPWALVAPHLTSKKQLENKPGHKVFPIIYWGKVWCIPPLRTSGRAHAFHGTFTPDIMGKR